MTADPNESVETSVGCCEDDSLVDDEGSDGGMDMDYGRDETAPPLRKGSAKNFVASMDQKKTCNDTVHEDWSGYCECMTPTGIVVRHAPVRGPLQFPKRSAAATLA